MTGLQLAMAAGLMITTGLVVLAWALTPARLRLTDVAQRFTPQAASTVREVGVVGAELSHQDRAGIWAQKHLPAAIWTKTNSEDLAIVGKELYRHRGEKVIAGLTGLLFLPVLNAARALSGQETTWGGPVLISVIVAGVLFMAPDLRLRTAAREARVEFRYALVSFVDLVAMQRRSRAGVRLAMEAAAAGAESYPFVRISRALALSTYERTTPWNALEALGDEIGVPELHSTAATMRSTGEQGAASYGALHAQSMLLRDALLNDVRAQAQDRSRNTTFPVIGLAVVFIVALGFPMMARLTQASF